MSERVRCPKCGAEMNHHADKLVHPVDQAEVAQMDRALGGVVQQTHGCPACGNVEFRMEKRARAGRWSLQHKRAVE